MHRVAHDESDGDEQKKTAKAAARENTHFVLVCVLVPTLCVMRHENIFFGGRWGHERAPVGLWQIVAPIRRIGDRMSTLQRILRANVSASSSFCEQAAQSRILLAHFRNGLRIVSANVCPNNLRGCQVHASGNIVLEARRCVRAPEPTPRALHVGAIRFI